MTGRRKREQPVDRALRELEQQLKQVRRDIDHLSEQPAQPLPAPGRNGAPSAAGAAAPGMGGFVRQMLTPPRTQPAVTYRARKDLFDVADRAVTQLELEPVAFGPPAADRDLFQAAVAAHDGAAAEPVTAGERLAAGGSKLMEYLSAGSIRSYRTPRRAQREERNRFLGWMGVAALAVWLIWVIVR